jgi:hypothetical protein
MIAIEWACGIGWKGLHWTVAGSALLVRSPISVADNLSIGNWLCD